MRSSKCITIILLLCILLIPSKYSIAKDNFIAGDTLNRKKANVYKALGFTTAYYAGSLYILGKTWYKGRERVPFHFYNDNKGYLQVDKFGHTFGAYVYSYIGYHYLLTSGYTRKDALLYGATLGLVLQTPIEIMDGIHEGYGFSLGDMAANTMGSAIVIGQELVFKEQIIKYKFSYWESDYARKANGYLGTNSFNRIFKDYNGQTYWLSCPINKILPNKLTPDWLNIAVGYGANGMYGEFKNISEYNGVAIPTTTRYRQYLLSLDIDWTRIKCKSKFLKILLKGLTFVKLPFPTLEYNSKGKFKGYYLYY
jgi:hypothetical protein